MFNALGVLACRRLKTERVPFCPITVDIEPATICNFRCGFCQAPTMHGRTPFLSYDDFCRILDELPYVLRIKLQGMGEPLLNKDFFAMVAHARRKGIYTTTITNGSLLTQGNCQRLIESGLDKIYISIDGATKETFETMRPGGDFHVVIENVRRLAAMRIRKQPEVHLWVLCMRDNLDELPDIVRLGSDLGVDEVGLQYDLNFWGKEDYRSRFRDQLLTRDEPLKKIEEAVATARRLGVAIRVFTGDRFTPGNDCSWPWTSAYFTADGYVIPCCSRADPELFNAGRLTEKGDFKRIWNGDSYRALRRSIRTHHLWDYCTDCYLD
jgi:MoaA/NifB/PqqE/SkfB family radical SAM enzyme